MRTTTRLTTRLLGPLAAVVLLVAACGDGNGDDTSAGQTPEPTETATGTEPTQEEEQGEDAEATVSVADSSLGMILVGEDDLTLYMFDADQQGTSTCYDDCEALWPPLTVTDDPVAGEGVEESLLATVERDDGSMQVTYNDWPLYYWAQDEAAGDVTGQAFDDLWWVIAPDGEPVRSSGGGDDDY